MGKGGAAIQHKGSPRPQRAFLGHLETGPGQRHGRLIEACHLAAHPVGAYQTRCDAVGQPIAALPQPGIPAAFGHGDDHPPRQALQRSLSQAIHQPHGRHHGAPVGHIVGKEGFACGIQNACCRRASSRLQYQPLQFRHQASCLVETDRQAQCRAILNLQDTDITQQFTAARIDLVMHAQGDGFTTGVPALRLMPQGTRQEGAGLGGHLQIEATGPARRTEGVAGKEPQTMVHGQAHAA